MAVRKKAPSEEEQVQAVLTKVRGVLLERGAVTAAKLGGAKIRARVIEQLRSEGYEAAGKGVRVPLATQGSRLLSDGAHVSLAMVPKRLAGASKVEADKLVQELCKSGQAYLVLRGKQLSLVPRTEAVVERPALADLEAELRGAATWLKNALANKSNATVLEADLRAAIDEIVAGVRKSTSPKPAHERRLGGTVETGPDRALRGAGLAEALRGAVLAARDEESLLARVPDVSRRLRDRATAEEVQGELLAAHRRGEIELRPEGGIGRLSEEDSVLCPPGPGGVRLSWVRLLGEMP
jgi:hypothetical protein